MGTLLALAMSSCANLANAEDASDRFQLGNRCKPIALPVHVEYEAGPFGERAETLVRSRLRAAQIHDEDAELMRLGTNVDALEGMAAILSVDLMFQKALHDICVTGGTGLADTWAVGALGFTTRDDASASLLPALSEATGKFIEEGLRVNADS